VRRREEQGAVAVFVALLMVVVVAVAAIAVDLGMQRVVRSDMQAVADVVALDLAREMGNRTARDIGDDPAWDAALAESLSRNMTHLGDDLQVEPVLGKLNAVGQFVPLGASELDAVPTAVRVDAGAGVDFAFAPGRGTATRSAVASPTAVACFSVGAVAASLSSSDSPLLSLLKGIVGVDLTAISAEGIVDIGNVSVPLLALATELGVGSLDELVDLGPITVGDLAVAMAAVLAEDTSNAAVVELLDGIASLPVGQVQLVLGEILSLGPGATSALNLDVGVLDLVTAALFVAGRHTTEGGEDESHAIGVPALSVSFPPGPSPLISLSAKVGVIAPPRIACGTPGLNTLAESAQIRVFLSGQVLRSAIDERDGFWDTLAKIAHVKLDLDLALGQATGRLDAVRCGVAGAYDEIDVAVQTALLRADVSLDVEVLWGLINPDPVVIDDATIGTTSTALETLRWQPAPDDTLPSAQVRAPLSSLGLATLVPRVKSGLWLLDILIVNPLVDLIVKPLLQGADAILTPVVNALSRLLGLSLSGADVRGEARPNCNSARLVG
jgi:uncharacterized membrane protein